MNFNLKSLKFFLVTFFIFIILDATVGKYIYKKFVREQLKDKNPNFSKYDEFFDHKFPKNFDAIGGWGNFRYLSCNKRQRDMSLMSPSISLNCFELIFLSICISHLFVISGESKKAFFIT